jgi:threonine dehydrogenase-like Zn-dependent dehydrogenase
MKAIRFNVNALTYVALKLLGSFSRKAYYGRLSGIKYKEVPEPALPGDDWVKVRTTFGGICGSDLNLIYLHDSPSASPFASMPFIIGHENVGVISETGSAVEDFAVGDRVVADPVLPCAARGIDEPCPSCQRGEYSTCRNFTRGNLKPGMSMGICQDVGGSWGECFVAHRSQLVRVPAEVPDDEAVLVDPLASALHPVMRHFPKDGENVLVIGAGIIGLLTIGCLRALGSKAHITILARHRFQGELAQKQGADEVVYGRGDYYKSLAEVGGAELLKPIIGKRIVQGGFDTIYDCVGSDRTLDDALRFTAPGGKMVLIGLAAIPKGVDWTPIWLKEISVAGAVYYSTEQYQGRPIRTYELAMDLIEQKKVNLQGLLTHTFPLSDYRHAIEVASGKKSHNSVKVAFRF